MKTNSNNPHPFRSALARALAVCLSYSLAMEPVLAGTITISSTPLATAGADAVLPNLMFILDGSGSMDSDYNGDYVNDNSKCMTRSSSNTNCLRGDPPYEAGGAHGFNGVGYDPFVNYKTGVKSTGADFLTSITLTAVPNDAYGAQSTSNTNVTAGLTDTRFCNGNGNCKRPGADTTGVLVSGADDQGRTMSAGRFPYRTNAANSSATIFGLPEMMSMGVFVRASGTVTVTTLHTHGLTTADFVYPTGTGDSNLDLNTCVAVTSVGTNTFTYTSGTTSTSSKTGQFRKCVSASFIRNVPTSPGPGYVGSPTSLVRVTSTAHGLQNGDQITMTNLPASSLNQSEAPVTVVDANTFTYDSGSSTAQAATTAQWVRVGNGLYNQRATVASTATSYFITPIEYCTDANLTNCVEVIPGSSAPSGFTFPAYTRFCRTQEQAYSPAVIADASGTPRCRSKFVGSGTTKWIWPRFGWFNRDTIISTTATYTRSTARTDCTGAPTCTYAQEIANYARWWAYYRTRMQMMKTSAGRAFLPFISKPTATPSVPNKLRVGFINLEPRYQRNSNTKSSGVITSTASDSPAYSGNYLAIAPFETTQASNWYTTFYNQIPNQSTPLREALSRVGWIYSGKLGSGLTAGIPAADDPIERACQKNYTILTTDGYWNGNDGQDITGGEIGNPDGVDPTTDNPYTQVVVDRATTVTFDGGYPQIIQTDTPSTVTEQVACYGNSVQTTFAGGTQTSCGCTSGNSAHRIRQRVTTTVHRVITSNGVVTSDTLLTPTYSQSTVTSCTTSYQISTVTPQTNLEQIVCSGTGTNTATFSQGTATSCSCGTAPLTKRVKQQTRTRTHTVTTTDGVVTTDSYSPASTWTDTFQNLNAANGVSGCQSLIVTTVTPQRDSSQVLCSQNSSTTWTTATNGQNPTSACQCGSSSLQKMILQRNVDYTNTTVTNDGVTTSNTNTTGSSSFTPAVACNATEIVTTTNLRDKQQRLCQGTNAITWAAAGNGANPAQACVCANPNAKAIVERRIDYTTTATTRDGTSYPPGNTTSAPGTLQPITTVVACNFAATHQDRSNASTTETKVCGPAVGVTSVTFTDGFVVNCTCNSGRSVRIQENLTSATVRTSFADGVALSPLTLVVPGTRGPILWSTTGGFSSTVISGSSCSNSSLSPNVFTPSGGTNGSVINDGGTTVTNNSVSPVAPNGTIQTLAGPTPTTTPGSATVDASMIATFTNPLANGSQTITPVGYQVTSADLTLTPNPQGPTDGTAVVTTTGTAFTAADFTISPNPSSPVVGSATSTTTADGSANTLADVAMYYYRTDLRGGSDIRGAATGPALNAAGTDVSDNVVPAKTGAKDFVTHQHMVTFTVGLADGLLLYQTDYETSSTGDYANIKAGTSDACFWVTGTCNWPLPVADDASALDDLWHAAVNGRGQFYLANNAEALATGIQTALTAVNAQVAAAAASATSSPNVTQTDNQIFSTTYETNTWSGKVFAQTIDASTGNVDATIQWQADGQLLSKVTATGDSRRIFTFDGSAGTLLKNFTWAELSTSEQANFLNKCVPSSTMTQCTGLIGSQITTANDGTSLVGFLRGQLGNEGTVFRDRTYIDLANNSAIVQTVLGDTISAKPAFLRNPTSNYGDTGYATFFTTNALRSPRVYVGANDGFLHAFHGNTGEERWAYLPRFLMPGLFTLADTAYSKVHRYYADGSPETGDVFDTTASQWKSILVAGVAGGGRGYYALDVTDPDNPQGLWEFCNDASLCAISDADLGLTYGNPVIGKRKSDGKWVVVVTSGLNNVSPGTTGIGYFYVLDAIKGTVLEKVATTAGTFATPSGLMKASGFYDSALTDASFTYVYGGDQLGNVWRLDLTATTGSTVMLMTTLLDAAGRAQPITTRPALTHIGTSRVLYIGTGRYLGDPDLKDPGAPSGIAWQQSLYAFKDKDVEYGSPGDALRAKANLVQQVLSKVSPTERGISANAVDWNTKDGWYIDFNPVFSSVEDSPGEGVNLVDPKLALGTLVVTTNVPATGGASCSVGGSSFDYNFDFKTGQAVSTSQGGVVGRSLGGTITVGVAIVQLPSGAIKSISTGADTSKTSSSVNTSTAASSVKRFSYRVR